MSARDKLLSYILKFAREENLNDLEELLAEKYPECLDMSRLNIPHRALYEAIEDLENRREMEATNDVRELLSFYDNILPIPSPSIPNNNIKISQITNPLSTTPIVDLNDSTSSPRESQQGFAHSMNVLSLSNHPVLPRVVISTSSSRDLVASYLPTTLTLPSSEQSSTTPTNPLILARAPPLGAVILTTATVLCHDPVTNTYLYYVLCGSIDGHLLVYRLDGITAELLHPDHLSKHDKNIDELFAAASFSFHQVADINIHLRYLTRISLQSDLYDPLPVNGQIRFITASHDNTIAIIDMQIDPTNVSSVDISIIKQLEFKGKVESICALPVPTVFKEKTHPAIVNPDLIPQAHFNRLQRSSIRKLQKGNYLDDFEFITKAIPFELQYDDDQTTTTTTTTTPSPSPPTVLFAVAVRGDTRIHIIDSNNGIIVDNINVNITGDDHVSFNVLDMVFDSYAGLLYLATDSHTIIIMDLITRQHIRRLYCTDNGELSGPILRLLSLPYNDQTSTTYTIPNGSKHIPYVVAITTQNNSIKLYNPGTQEQIYEFVGHGKNIKGFIALPSSQPTVPLSIVTTGFDKTFNIHF